MRYEGSTPSYREPMGVGEAMPFKTLTFNSSYIKLMSIFIFGFQKRLNVYGYKNVINVAGRASTLFQREGSFW